MAETLKEKVFEAMDNAEHNTEGFVSGSPMQIAIDMATYCSEVEDENPVDLVPHIVEWQEQRRKVQ